MCECISHTSMAQYNIMPKHWSALQAGGMPLPVLSQSVRCRVVQVWLMLAPDLQACGNKQQSRQEARCNSTNF